MGFREAEILCMSRGKIRSYDRAWDEIVHPEKQQQGTKVKRRKKKR
jgi:hypothetical protein